jgi:hypothetical protein
MNDPRYRLEKFMLANKGEWIESDDVIRGIGRKPCKSTRSVITRWVIGLRRFGYQVKAERKSTRIEGRLFHNMRFRLDEKNTTIKSAI